MAGGDVETDDFERWLAGWDPEPSAADDSMDARPAAALAAVLDQPPPPSTVLAPLWHWLYFLRWPPTGALGADGHPFEGDFLPPVPRRTRMFAGGRLHVDAGLRTGEPATRHSAVASSTVRTGRSGTMLFVTVRHRIEQGGKVALVDEQEYLYRSGAAARTPAPVAAPPARTPTSDAAWQRPFSAGPVRLFGFSALTANSHRIHYDHPYVTGVEGYPGLVVHGPLLAIVMAGLAVAHRPLATMDYRFVRPTFAGEPLLVTGRPDGDGAAMAVLGPDGERRAQADVTFA